MNRLDRLTIIALHASLLRVVVQDEEESVDRARLDAILEDVGAMRDALGTPTELRLAAERLAAQYPEQFTA